jgi:hypothetical protein
VRQIFHGVFLLRVTSRALALVVVNEIVARSWLASACWAVWDVEADAHAILHSSLEATVTSALVVVKMIACGVCLVHAFAVGTTCVSFAIVHVEATSVICDGSICLAAFCVFQGTPEAAIERVAWVAIESSTVREEELLLGRKPLHWLCCD